MHTRRNSIEVGIVGRSVENCVLAVVIIKDGTV